MTHISTLVLIHIRLWNIFDSVNFLLIHRVKKYRLQRYYVPFAGQKNEKVKFQLHLKDNTNLELP